MSDLYINIRLFQWNLKVSYNWKITVSKNSYHKEKGYPDGYFAVYQFFNVNNMAKYKIIEESNALPEGWEDVLIAMRWSTSVRKITK